MGILKEQRQNGVNRGGTAKQTPDSEQTINDGVVDQTDAITLDTDWEMTKTMNLQLTYDCMISV